MALYCGNNRNDPKITGGTHTIGSNYQCLRKGIGTGLHMPYDPSYTLPHAPIDGRKYYCGNQVPPPAGRGYFSTGSPSICFRTGVGVGRAQRAAMGPGGPVGPAAPGPVPPAPPIAHARPAGVAPARPIPPIIPPNGYGIKYYLPITIFFLICTVIFIVFYFSKISFFMKKDDKTGEDVINYTIFVPYYVLSCVISGIIIYIIWKKVS